MYIILALTIASTIRTTGLFASCLYAIVWLTGLAKRSRHKVISFKHYQLEKDEVSSGSPEPRVHSVIDLQATDHNSNITKGKLLSGTLYITSLIFINEIELRSWINIYEIFAGLISAQAI